MADDVQTATQQDFTVSVGQTLITTQEQALAVYYQMQSYPEMRALLSKYESEISRAIQQKDAGALIGVIQKVQSDFLRSFSEKPPQIQADTERKIQESHIQEDVINQKVAATQQALGDAYKTAETVHTAKQTKNKSFIKELVDKYSRLPPAESQALTDTLVATAESYPELSPQDIISQATKTFPSVSEDVSRQLQRQKNVIQNVVQAKNNDITVIEQQVIQAVLDSPDPKTTISTIQTYADTDSLPKLIDKAQVLARATNEIQQITNQQVTDYAGFFTSISKTPIEKTLAPLADAIFTIFPKDVQQTMVARIFGASWNKDVANNAWLQQAVGPLLQSHPVQLAIQNGNLLFNASGTGVFTKTQSFFSDIFVTVFRPQVSDMYLQLAGFGNMQMSASLNKWYAGYLAKQGVSYAASQGIKTAGKAVAAKAASGTLAKILGGVAGGATANPIVGAAVSLVGQKILDGITNGAKKFFNFLTLDWLSRLFSGDLEGGKDPVLLIVAAVIGVFALLFVFPFLTPFSSSLGGSAPSQQTYQDSALLQNVGGKIGNGTSVDCVAKPDDPLCSMSACDPAKQDCRWPTNGVISQGPLTTCGGSHATLNAIDIGAATGTDVYATINGTVTYVSSDVERPCLDNTGYWGNSCGKGYGNYIVIKGSNYSLTFGHLSLKSIAVHKNQHVDATTVIAEVDNNGNSSGPHLHFEYSGPGSINSILPVAIPACSNATPGCSACPYLSVGGGKK